MTNAHQTADEGVPTNADKDIHQHTTEANDGKDDDLVQHTTISGVDEDDHAVDLTEMNRYAKYSKVGDDDRDSETLEVSECPNRGGRGPYAN